MQLFGLLKCIISEKGKTPKKIHKRKRGMKMKKIISIALTAAMVFSSMVFTAFAEDEENGVVPISAPVDSSKPVPISAPEDTSEAPVLISASVQNIEKVTYNGTVEEAGEGYITLKEEKIQLNYDKNTLVCDYDFMPYESIKAGDSVTVVADTVTTMSIPAQSYAYYILVNTKNSSAAPIYAKVLSNDGKEIMSADNQNKIIISDETPTSHYRAKIKIMAKDIPAGSEIFAFATTVGLSMPAYVPAEKIVVINMGEEAKEPSEGAEDITITKPADPDSVTYNGTVEEAGEGYITLKEEKIQLNYDKNTLVCDYDFMPYESIKAGDSVTVVADTVTTMSIPAQSYAYYILVNTKNSSAAPIYAKVLSNDGKEIASADGKYTIAYTDETPTAHSKAKLKIMAKDITKGSEIFAFAETVGLSIPAYVAPEKITVVNLAQDTDTADVEKIIVDDKTYEVSFNYERKEEFGTNSTARFALRPVCEALGYDVSWVGETQSIVLSKDGKDVSLDIGVAVQKIGHTPMIIDGKTYVTLSLFNVLYGDEAEVSQVDNAVVVKTK